MNENTMEMGAGGIRLGGVVETSTIDWYGNVSLVAFFAGCNFRCPYCQNSGLIPLDSGKIVGPEYLEKRLEDEKKLLDAVVISGGEPLLQPEGIKVVCQLVKEMGFKVMLNTNGSRPRVIEGLLNDGLIDRVALDVKAPLNPSSYSPFTGTERGDIPALVKRSLDICKERGVEVEARTTVAPGLSDESWFIKAIAEDIRDLGGMYVLQQFDNMGEVLSQDLKSKTPLTKEKLIALAAVASDAGVKRVYIKTRRTGLERIR
jgi:pyruvate formate lyase activating enzyme